MSLEAKAILLKAGAKIGKTLSLEQFQSDGTMKFGVGEMKAVMKVSNLDGAIQQIHQHVKEYDCSVKIPMKQNPGYDLAPDSEDPRRAVKVHWADVPDEERGIELVLAEIARMEEQIAQLRAEHAASQKNDANEDGEAPKPRRGRPPANRAQDQQAQADDTAAETEVA